jgi:hypothetical protein
VLRFEFTSISVWLDIVSIRQLLHVARLKRLSSKIAYAAFVLQ